MFPFSNRKIEIINEIEKHKIIDIDKNQIEQVIINLITNSIFKRKKKRKKHTANYTTQNNRFTSPYLIMVEELKAKKTKYSTLLLLEKMAPALDLRFRKYYRSTWRLSESSN
jgi:hypothetical protein